MLSGPFVCSDEAVNAGTPCLFPQGVLDNFRDGEIADRGHLTKRIIKHAKAGNGLNLPG